MSRSGGLRQVDHQGQVLLAGVEVTVGVEAYDHATGQHLDFRQGGEWGDDVVGKEVRGLGKGKW